MVERLNLRALQNDLQSKLNQKMELIDAASVASKYSNKHILPPYGVLDECCIYGSERAWKDMYNRCKDALQMAIENGQTIVSTSPRTWLKGFYSELPLLKEEVKVLVRLHDSDVTMPDQLETLYGIQMSPERTFV